MAIKNPTRLQVVIGAKDLDRMKKKAFKKKIKLSKFVREYLLAWLQE